MKNSSTIIVINFESLFFLIEKEKILRFKNVIEFIFYTWLEYKYLFKDEEKDNEVNYILASFINSNDNEQQEMDKTTITFRVLDLINKNLKFNDLNFTKTIITNYWENSNFLITIN